MSGYNYLEENSFSKRMFEKHLTFFLFNYNPDFNMFLHLRFLKYLRNIANSPSNTTKTKASYCLP